MFEKFRKLNKKIPVMSPSIGNVQGYVGALLKYWEEPLCYRSDF